MCSLPHDILFDEIFARLHVKPLFCFKTVCRSWCFIISSPDFAKIHLKFSSSRQVFLIEIFESRVPWGPRSLHLLPYKECNNDVDDINGLIKLIHEFCPKIDCLVGCCNGIVCLALLDKYRRVIKYNFWNPATHEYREIDNPYKDFEAMCLGFGYIFSIDDYKIAAIYYDFEEKVKHAYHYSLKTGTWTRVVADVPPNEVVANVARKYNTMRPRGDMFFYEDKIYWMGNKIVVAINLITEKWVQYSLEHMYSEYEFVNLFMAQQCLAFVGVGRDQSCYDVWMMDKVGDWNSWKKLFSVDNLGQRMRFLNATENGIYLTNAHAASYGDNFYVVDATRKTSRQTFCYYICSLYAPKTVFYHDTLISPFT